MFLSLALAVWQFEVPLRGSFWIVIVTSALFMLVSLMIGLLISIVSKNQFVAGQLAIIITFLPAFILSGFLFDINSMPTAIQAVTLIVPSRYFVSLLQTLFLAGDVWPVIIPNSLVLLAMLVFFYVIVLRKFKKRLE